MKLKKLLAVLSACALVFALAVPAFAAGATGGDIPNDTMIDFTGKPAEEGKNDQELTVSVSVLYNIHHLYVNPYGLPYTVKDGAISGDSDVTTIKEGTTTAGWFSNTAVIKNTAPAALNVSVTMKTTEHGNVEVVESAPNGTPAKNTLYGDFVIANATIANKVVTPQWTAEGGGDHASLKRVTIPAVSTNITQPQPTGYVLAAATTTTNAATGATTSVPSYAAFRLLGKAVLGGGNASGGSATNGNTSGLWASADLADVSVAFSFSPAT